MAALILRVRTLINDTLPVGNGQIFTDQTIQDVMDESRMDFKNVMLKPAPTFTTGIVQYLDYWADYGGGWEDSTTFKQWLSSSVTPSLSEPIAGHWQFSASTLPPVYISGAVMDCYRAAADLLERQSAQWLMSYNIVVDGQNLQRSQVADAMQKLARSYRMKQRPGTIQAIRTDLNATQRPDEGLSGPRFYDYMTKG
jgi:hypothetical protein